MVLCESGGVELEAETQALYEGDRSGYPFWSTVEGAHEFGLDELRLRYFGGTTNHWNGMCRPLDPIDFEVRDDLPETGWPISRSELDGFYAEAQLVCQLGPLEYDPAWWNDRYGTGPPIVDDGILETVVFQISPPTRFGQTYRDELRGSPAVQILLHANAIEIETGDDTRTVTGVQLATLDGNRLRAEARAYVIATGGIEVPRLLLASNRARPAGLGNDHDLVGRFFMEHLVVETGVVPFPTPRLTPWVAAPAPVQLTPLSAIRVFYALSPTEATLRRMRIRPLSVQLSPTRYGLPLDRPDGALGEPEVGVLADTVDGSTPRSSVALEVRAEQAPDPDNRITLLRERDALGMPRVKLHWRPTRDDHANLVTNLRLVARSLGAAGLRAGPHGSRP